MKKHRIIGALAFAGVTMFSSNVFAACGPTTIAEMNWASAQFVAQLDKLILTNGFGCDASTVQGDSVPTSTSMAEKGQPDVAPQITIDAVRAVIEDGVARGKLRYVGKSLSDGQIEGWYVPKYLVDANPDLSKISGVLNHPELFSNPENLSRGLIMGCPAGWNCQITNTNLYRAFELEKAGFDLGDPGSAAGLDASLAKAYERREGWLGYYWAPTILLGKYDLVKIDLEVEFSNEEWKRCTSVSDCPDPQKNAFPSTDVLTVATTKFAESSPDAIAYLEKRSLSNEQMGKILVWMGDNQASGEEAAKYFLKHNRDIWGNWLPESVAEKVAGAL